MQNFQILLAYDDPHMLEVIGWTLKDTGCGLMTAQSAEVAIKAIENHSFDAVLIDLAMNAAAGFSVLERTKEVSPETMVILLVCEEADDVQDELLYEADEFVLKPCGMGKLWKRVSGCLERVQLKRQLALAEAKIRKLSSVDQN